MTTGCVAFAQAVRRAMATVPGPAGARRPSTRAICDALTNALRPVVEAEFGGPVYRRYSGCPDGPAKAFSKTPGRAFKVLEYLWDFSLSRHAIPQAIGDPHATPMPTGQGLFELLLVGESELGTQTEVCRDLLKLLEARARIRCLVYREPTRARDLRRLESRMIQTMRNHARLHESLGTWLFVALRWPDGKIACAVRTVTRQLDGLVEIGRGQTRA